jgi:hypothetical protein
MMIKRTRGRTNLISKQKQLLAQQKLTQQAQQVRQQKKVTFAQLENLIALSRQAKNPRALHRWKKVYQKKEQNWARALLKGQQKLIAKRKPALLVKSAPLYSQLRKQVRQEEKFLFLRELNPRINWDQSQSAKVSFLQSQEINKRTNLTLRELSQLRESRIKNYQEKTSWSLRKQRARIRKVRGKIDEEAYQKKLVERAKFQEKLGNYKGKLAREQYWSKKFKASPISLAQAELMALRIQPEHPPTHQVEAEIFAFKHRKKVPDEVFTQPWLSYQEKKAAKFGSIFSGIPRLKKEESVREPLIADKLKEYQYKVNFYQLFGHPPRTEKEIRKFASIDWEKEKKNYELLWKIKQRGHKKLDIPLLPWGDSRWHMTQKQILQEGSLNAWWKQAGEEELALAIARFHKLNSQTKFWATGAKRWNDPEFRRSLLPKTHPDHKPYEYESSENYQLDQVNKKYLSKELWKKGERIASQKWVDYLQRAQEQLQNEGINAQLHLNGLYSSFILSKCSIHCQCNVIGGTEYYETESSLPWCETCRIFNTTTNFIFADKNGHPPLAPGQCPYLNSSQWSREEYGKVSRWVQCGNLMPKKGETWHHDFDAWHKGARGWGCHLGFPQVMSKKQKSRSTIVEMEW